MGDDRSDVWTFDVARGTLTRQSFGREKDETPMWSPDGQWIAWALSEGGQSTVFRRRADGAGPPEALSKLPSPIHTHVEDWMADGRLLVSNAQTPGSPNAYVALLGLDADRMLTPLLRPSYNVREARASPDGRWIAYSSQESGRYEVYVQPFPSLEGKWQIFNGWGNRTGMVTQGRRTVLPGGRRAHGSSRLERGVVFGWRSPKVVR
jgi:Tol biopolymer transport system component